MLSMKKMETVLFENLIIFKEINTRINNNI